MKTFLIAAICAVAVSAEARTVKSDTVDVYYINAKQVPNFDGSQLNGKTIKSYFIDTCPIEKKVVRAHMISTVPSTGDVVIVGSGKMSDISVSSVAGNAPSFMVRTDPNAGVTDVMFVVDGVKMSSEEAQKISPKDIVSMEILNGSEAKKYSGKDDVGVVIVTTKNKK